MSASRRTRSGSGTATRSPSKTTRKKAARKPASSAAAKTQKSRTARSRPTKRAKAGEPAAGGRTAAKRTTARKTAAKKTTARKSTAKKAEAKTKATASKGAAKKATAKKKAPARRSAASKATAGRAPAARSASRKAAARPKAGKKTARTPKATATKAKSGSKTAAKTKPKAAPRAKKTATKKAASTGKATRKQKPAAKAATKKAVTAKAAAPAETTTDAPAQPAAPRSDNLPETQPAADAKDARRDPEARPARRKKLRKRARSAETLPLVTGKDRDGKARGKRRREKKAKPPAKTMHAPEPTREVLVFDEMPDVRRALTASRRRDSARGHLQPTMPDATQPEDEPGERAPLDAALIMNTLAVDVQPKIEDNYDYSVLDEFRESGHCPKPTRMVNTGCGGGEAAVYFAKLGFQCVGIDPDRSDVGLARERAWLAGVDIDFMVGDLFETPNLLPAESFGLAIDRGAFFQIEDERDRQRYLANIKRLLFKGGMLLLSTGYFPLDGDTKPRRGKGGKILLANEGGVVVQEMRAAGFQMMKRILRTTADSGELGELLLYLRK